MYDTRFLPAVFAILVFVLCIDLAEPQDAQCSAVLRAVQDLAEAFPCVRDYCNGGTDAIQPPTTATQAPIVRPPVVGPTQAPVVAPPVIAPPTETSSDVQVGTYLPNWFVYKKHFMGIKMLNSDGALKPDGSKYTAEDASAEYIFWPSQNKALIPLITHMYYSFLDLDESCNVVDPDADASWYGKTSEQPSWIVVPNGACKGLMNDMMSLKSQFPHLKLMLSVGGWTYSRHFSKCTSSKDNRAKIYKTFDNFIKQMDPAWGTSNAVWSGIDWDWEFPETDQGLHPEHSANDWDNYASLINEFRSQALATGKGEVVITSAIGLGTTLDLLVAKKQTARAFCDGLDFVNMMHYDLHGKWDPTTGHNAPFCPDTHPNAHPKRDSGRSVLETTKKMGSVCPMKKLCLGLPNYSPAWTHIPETNNGLYQRSTEATKWAGWSTFSDSADGIESQGLLSYWDLKKTLKSDSSFKMYERLCPAENGVIVPVRHLYSKTHKAFTCYDDEVVASKKAQWAKAIGMGGFFFWDMQQDKEGSLLKAARDGWGGLPIHVASGNPKCFDSKKPNYSLDPVSGKEVVVGCSATNRKLVFPSGGSCFEMQQKATAVCGGKKPVAIGGSRGSECLTICSPTWGNGSTGAWPGDYVHFICPGEAVENGATGNVNGNVGNIGGNVQMPVNESNFRDCKTCSQCVRDPNSVQAVTDDHCAPCSHGQTWWPCNVVPPICKCA